ncbi:MAG: hypothetical protein M9927_08760 [Anaerolineae bacterium]|nr:hypothetical protein [Anaerolineae bacterium]
MPQKRHAPNPACRQCHGTGRTRYHFWLADDTWETTEETDCWCTTTRQYPDPDCPHCHGTGEVEQRFWDSWVTPNYIKVPCRCMQKPVLPDPFPDRPDMGDGLPENYKREYVGNDYR